MLTCIQVAYKSSIRIPNFNVSALKLGHLTEDADASIPRTMSIKLEEEGGRLAASPARKAFSYMGYPRIIVSILSLGMNLWGMAVCVYSRQLGCPLASSQELEVQADTNISLNEAKTITFFSDSDA